MPLDGAFLANPVHVVADVMAELLQPPAAVDFNAWAKEHVVFGQESPFPGEYRDHRFPFFRRVLEVLGPDHPARVVVMMKSAQLGGTVLAQIFLGGSLDLDPGPFMYIHPSEGNATRWARTKWRPMLRNTSVLTGLFGAASTREGGNSTLYQERKDGRGFLQISGANSEASLSMISVPRQVQDDLSKWELNNAGDPETQADSRSKAFEWAKIFKISTPLIEDNCRITRVFAKSTQEHYHVPCPDPDCGFMHRLEWENLLANLDEAHPEDAHFTCPDCGGKIEQHHLPDMLLGGRWIADNPGASIIGFHLWSAYSLLESWQRIAEAWIAAKGDPAKEQAFENDTLGRAYRAAGESPPWEGLRDRAEAGERRRGVIPRGALLLVFGMDCQDDRVEWHFIGFGRDLRRWTIDYGTVDHHISTPAALSELDALMKRQWPDTLGNRREVSLAAIDGNAWTNEVFDWVKRHPQSRVIMVRGVHPDAAPPLAFVKKERGKDGKIKKYQRRFFNVGVSGLKLGYYKNLTKTDPLERGYVDFPAGMGDEFFRQTTAERRVPVNRRGFTVYRWVKSREQANEALDTAIYAEAAAIKLGWRTMSDADWDRLEAELETPPASGQLDFEDLIGVVKKLAALAAPASPTAADSPPPVSGETAPSASARRTTSLAAKLA